MRKQKFSPRRMCHYSSKKDEDNKHSDLKLKETFGVHADTSFVTFVPVAEVSGLEVFDKTADCAQKDWESEQDKRGLHSSATTG